MSRGGLHFFLCGTGACRGGGVVACLLLASRLDWSTSQCARVCLPCRWVHGAPTWLFALKVTIVSRGPLLLGDAVSCCSYATRCYTCFADVSPEGGLPASSCLYYLHVQVTASVSVFLCWCSSYSSGGFSLELLSYIPFGRRWLLRLWSCWVSLFYDEFASMQGKAVLRAHAGGWGLLTPATLCDADTPLHALPEWTPICKIPCVIYHGDTVARLPLRTMDVVDLF